MTKSVHIFIMFAECSSTLNQWVLFVDRSMILCFQYIYHNMIVHIYGLKSIKYCLLNMNDSPLMITEHLIVYIHWWSKLSSFLRHKWQVPTLAILFRPFGVLLLNTFKLFDFPILRYWAYLIKVTIETRTQFDIFASITVDDYWTPIYYVHLWS